MYDALVTLQSLTTTTANYTGTAIDLGPAGGTPRRGYKCNGLIGLTANGATAVGATCTATFFMYHGTSTATLRKLAQQLEAPFNLTVGYNTSFHIPFETDLQYVAVGVEFNISTNATVPWQADVTFARPF